MLDRKQFLKTMYAATFYSGEINYIALSDSEFVFLSKFVHFLYQTNWTMPEIYLYWWIYTGYTVWLMDIYWLRYLLSIFRTYFCNLFNQPISSLDGLALKKVDSWACSIGNAFIEIGWNQRGLLLEKKTCLCLYCIAMHLHCIVNVKKRILRIYF